MKDSLILINILFENLSVIFVASLHTKNINTERPKREIAAPKLIKWKDPFIKYQKNAINDPIPPETKLNSTEYATITNTHTNI